MFHRRPRSTRSAPSTALTVDDLAGVALAIADDPPPPGSEFANGVIRATLDGDHVAFAVLPVPEHLHPGTVLLGQVAPPEWDVVGITAPATVHGPSGADPGQVVVLADRGGRVLHEVTGIEVETVPEGTAVDVLRRVLRLPTPPPGRGPLLAWSMWAAADPDRPCLADLLPHADAAEPDAWAALRAWLTAPGDHVDPEARRAHAELGALVDGAPLDWHDDGSFARWVEAVTGAALLDLDLE